MSIGYRIVYYFGDIGYICRMFGGLLFRGMFFNRLCCVVMAAHLFNFSIDPRDMAPADIPENLALNDIESFAEFLCEEVLGLTDSFEETDEADANAESTDTIQKVFFSSCFTGALSVPMTFTCVRYLVRNTPTMELFAVEITIPPPR
jgi:hypothetical protein